MFKSPHNRLQAESLPPLDSHAQKVSFQLAIVVNYVYWFTFNSETHECNIVESRWNIIYHGKWKYGSNWTFSHFIGWCLCWFLNYSYTTGVCAGSQLPESPLQLALNLFMSCRCPCWLSTAWVTSSAGFRSRRPSRPTCSTLCSVSPPLAVKRRLVSTSVYLYIRTIGLHHVQNTSFFPKIYIQGKRICMLI